MPRARSQDEDTLRLTNTSRYCDWQSWISDDTEGRDANGRVLTTNSTAEWAVLTVVEDGATASPQLKKFVLHEEQSRARLRE